MDDNFFQREFVEKENNKVEEESIVKEVNTTNSNHIQQSQINSLNKTNDDLIQEPEVGKTSTCINIDDQDNTSNKDDGKDENSLEGVLKKMELQENEIKTLKSAFHKLENEHIVRDEKINNLTIMCEKIITKFEDIDQIKSEVHKINQSVEKLDFVSTNENYKENKAQNLLNNSKLAENYKEIQRVKDQGSEICKVVDSLNIKTTQIEKKVQEIKEEINPQLQEMHENLHVENSELKQLENSTKEMKENILEEINRHFMDLRIGVNTNFKTLERIQEVNKTCSEMKDLFKARCTQSVTQSDNNTQSMIEKESGNSIEKSKNTNIQKVDLWVIGSSIVKDLDGKKMYKNKQVKITTLRDKTVEGATKFVKLGTVHAKNVLLQIGSNDLEQKTPDDVLQEVELLVRELKSTLPEYTVVIGELLPRYYLVDRTKADAYNEKFGLYNILLRDYCVDTGLHYVQFENMIHSDFYDGIHPNFKGVKLYVRCIKEILNPLLSVRYDKNYPRSFNNGYSVRSNYDQNRSGYNKRDTNGYQGYRQDKHNSYNRYTENTNNGYTDSTNNRYTDNTNNRYTDNTNTSHMHMNNDRDNMYKMFEYMFSGMRDGHY
ncbi:uncharacterized protein MCAP_0864-like [Mytilus edulis]|uniref:uncharacterized protein MCAP_0864-like n=1 Tax=Mytilus edulis TaxID=6550 RepID=UPI0039EEC449